MLLLWRHRTHGSLLVQYTLRMIEECYKTDHLVDILIATMKQISHKKYGIKAKDPRFAYKAMQMPHLQTTFTEKFYFTIPKQPPRLTDALAPSGSKHPTHVLPGTDLNTVSQIE